MPKILVVEDDVHLRTVIRLVLERANHEVVEAADGWAAISIIDAGLPDLLLVDLKMPLMSGLELIDRVKSNPSTASLPIVLLTGNRDAAAGLRQQIQVVLKPFDPDYLLGALQAALNASRRQTRRSDAC
jgi:CheY-like chemotaxis protein